MSYGASNFAGALPIELGPLAGTPGTRTPNLRSSAALPIELPGGASRLPRVGFEPTSRGPGGATGTRTRSPSLQGRGRRPTPPLSCPPPAGCAGPDRGDTPGRAADPPGDAGGTGGIRTRYLLNAIEALSQVSYGPVLVLAVLGGPVADVIPSAVAPGSRRWLGRSRAPTPRKVISPSPTGPVGPDLVEPAGFEPAASSLRTRRSPK